MAQNLFPLPPQAYEKVLPTAFDNSLTILEKMNKMIEIIEAMLPYFPDIDGSLVDGFKVDLSDMKLSLGSALNRIGEQEKLWKSVNGSTSAEAGQSVYIKNDDNLFGYKKDGSHVNIGTIQQNDILQYGDTNANTVWLVSGGYHSMRSPNNPSFQLLDSNGAPVGPGRTLYHQGNSSYHLIAFADGEYTLQKGSRQSVPILTNINKVFPVGAFSGGKYTIPREGIYGFHVVVKIGSAPLGKGAIRVALERTSDGVTSNSDYDDLHYDPTTYSTPFLSTTIYAHFKKDDEVKLLLNPLNENITITNGTRFSIYNLGDSPQS